MIKRSDTESEEISSVRLVPAHVPARASAARVNIRVCAVAVVPLALALDARRAKGVSAPVVPAALRVRVDTAAVLGVAGVLARVGRAAAAIALVGGAVFRSRGSVELEGEAGREVGE